MEIIIKAPFIALMALTVVKLSSSSPIENEALQVIETLKKTPCKYVKH